MKTAKIVTLVLAAATLTLASCNIVGPASYAIFGQDKQPALFDLPDVPTVVFVDDRRNRLGRSNLRRIIGDKVSQDLMVKNVLTSTISPRDAIAYVRANEAHDQPMSIPEIGAAVGAQQVIYVEVKSFLANPGMTLQPSASAGIRVIDVVNNVKLFPDDPVGIEPAYAVQAMTREVSPEALRTAAGRRDIEEALAQSVGMEIARLFYKHIPNELGSTIGQ